ncbi:hypothetical protein ACLK1T_02535 [Escherichia coli]
MRVVGDSVVFTALSPDAQDHIIAGTEQMLDSPRPAASSPG